MGETKPTIVVTGISGNLGVRLLPQLSAFHVIGVDLHPPRAALSMRFVQMDLGNEESCRQLFLLLKESRAATVVHLAFVIDPVRSNVLDVNRMWQINVAGTARVMEAISEANRDEMIVTKFIFPSSASVYGSDMAHPAKEDAPLRAHTLPYAVHKMEADEVVQKRAPSLRGCSVYMLRPHIFAGASVDNYLLGAFRGTANGKSARAVRMRAAGERLPCMLPYGDRYGNNLIQFIHVDDMARLITFLASKTEPESQRLLVLNVAARGEPLTFFRCIEMAQAKLWRVPGQWLFRQILTLLWKLNISAIPPQAAPYMTGQYIMNTERLQKFLGGEYEQVIRYTNASAFADSFVSQPAAEGQAVSPR